MMLPISIINIICYVFMPLTATWDWSRQALFENFSTNFQSSVYPDFNSNWFFDAGKLIIETMTFNIFMPIVEFLMFWAIRYLYRAWDQRSLLPSNYKHTNCTSVQAFVDIYSGPVFFVHYKYSYIITVVYIAFMFGPLMPILFVTTTMSLLCLYLVEKICMAFAYRKPPMYDDELITFVLKILSYAPLLYAIMACQVYSNQ